LNFVFVAVVFLACFCIRKLNPGDKAEACECSRKYATEVHISRM
jgi:hypothetical protein